MSRRSDQGPGRAPAPAGTGALRQQVASWVSSLGDTMQSLRAELATWRQKVEGLQRERNDLLAELSRRDLAQAQVDHEEQRWHALLAETRRLEAELAGLRQEKERLAAEHAALVASLDGERQLRTSAEQEVALLEEQVQHLESMVELLRGAGGATGPREE